MARRMPPRYKSGPKKGQFMPKSARGGKSRRRRSNPPAATAAPRRRRRRSSSPTKRRRRRSNPPMMSARGMGRELVQGVKDAGGIVLGKAAARAVPTMFNLPQAGALGLAVQAGVAIAAGFVGHKAFGRDMGRMMLAGGLSAPIETFIVAKNIPLLAPALSPNQAIVALNGYANFAPQLGRYANRPLMLESAPAAGVSGYSNVYGNGGEDYP